MRTNLRRNRRASVGHRRGFTLLEMVIALALSVLLLSAVYASLDLYWKYSIAGQDDVQRSKLARSILRQIEVELRSVVYHDPASDAGGSPGLPAASGGAASGASSAGGGASSGGAASGGSSGNTVTPTTNRVTPTTNKVTPTSTSSASTSTASTTSTTDPAATDEAITPDAALTTTTSGLFGDGYTLMMHVSKPSRMVAYSSFADAAGSGGRTSDLMSVSYFVSGQGGGSLASMVTSPGLARMAGDRLQMSLADTSGNTAFLAANTQILAAEVTSISFSYYDSATSSWLSSWDSTAYAGLPCAVEVVLELKTPVIPGRKASSNSSATTVYRLTVVLPSAKVQLPETE